MPGTEFLLAGGKAGKLYLLNRSDLGGVNLQPDASDDTQIPQSFYVMDDPYYLPSATALDATRTHHIHGGPVYWEGPSGRWIYVWPENAYFRAFRFDNGRFITTPASQSTTTDPEGVAGGSAGMPGGMLSISANGNRDGIVWAAHPYRGDANHGVREGILRAYDATDLTIELWNSRKTPGDTWSFTKFCSPTVANGRVYLATCSKRLIVYGTTPREDDLAH